MQLQASAESDIVKYRVDSCIAGLYSYNQLQNI